MSEAPVPRAPSLLAPLDWGVPVPIAFGPGRIAEIGRRCRAMGVGAPLIVTDRGGRGLPFVARLQALLSEAGLSPALFSDISPNPLGDEIGTGRGAFRAGGHDAVIAIAGKALQDAAARTNPRGASRVEVRGLVEVAVVRGR